MRNIKIIQKRESPGALTPGVEGQRRVYCLGDHGYMFICHGGKIYRFSLEENNKQESAEVICGSEESLEDAVLMQFVSTTGLIYVANERGSFLQLALHGSEVEELLESEQGIAYFAVSPDSRYVAVATKQETLLLLSLPDLNTVAQLDLDGEETKQDISSKTVKIVWREDSHYFAVNYFENTKFQVKVFDEYGALHSKIEDENNLLSSILEWQPSGGLLAAVGTTPHGTVISLFERNGLKRADFYPYEGKMEKYEDNKINNLIWNASSDILSVVYENKLELWCRNNYVWMRKVTLNRKVEYISWDREDNYRLHIVDSVGVYTTYDVAFIYSSGFSAGSAIVASWNGNTIYSTPFRNSCCPPPHCLFQSSCSSDVKTIVVPEFWNGLLSVSSAGELTFWHYEVDCLKQLRTVIIPDFHLFEDSIDWLWPNKNNICCISQDSLVVFDIDGDFEEPEENVKLISRKLPSNQRIVSAFLNSRNKEDSSVLVQTVNNSVYRTDLTTGKAELQCKFSQVSTELKTIAETVIVSFDPLTRKLMIGWTKYPDCDPVLLNNDCTSFTVFQNSIIFVTIQGYLEIRNMDYLMRLLEKHTLGKEFSHEEEDVGKYTRKCEKGSQIATCCLNQMLEPALVLQIIPRGNLEIIYPRPLVIDAVKVAMRENKTNTEYEKIMNILRRHRIDYRVLMDEMKVLINETVNCRLEELLKTMVEQVKDSHSLVLLITDLNHDYFDCILMIKNILEEVLEKNVNRLSHIEESYLAAMAKLGLLEEALKSSLILGEAASNRELVQHRVKFLSFYCENPDILFDTALGTYDLSLASLVADCLGKDPKEYLPVLDNFQSMLELKRRFKIDDRIRRYHRAVIHLIRDQRVQHDEIIKYMERHRLFTDVIEFLIRKLKHGEGGVVERSSEDTALLLREAQSTYAMYLEERGKFLEASILFRDSGRVNEAISCCIKCGQWEFAMEIAYENNTADSSIEILYKQIIAQLEDKKMFGDAARVCENYIGDLQQAVYFLIKDRQWQRASTLSLKSSSLGKSFRDETVKPKLLDACEEFKDDIQQTTDDIKSKLQRLRKVKEIKAAKLAETGGLNDAFSDTESYISGSSVSGSIASSNMSDKSFRSGKNKRKLERKVYSLKEGSKHEDLALIAHMWISIDRVQNEIKPNVSNTIEALWKFDKSDKATCLCTLLENLLLVADECVKEVWSVPVADEILETKYRFPLTNWNPLLPKLALHDSSSKAVGR